MPEVIIQPISGWPSLCDDGGGGGGGDDDDDDDNDMNDNKNKKITFQYSFYSVWQDKRNVLRNPPSGVQFYFDYESIFPIAMVMLDEDPNLKALRFELVPKQSVTRFSKF